MADKLEIVNDYFSKIIKYHKNNLKVFSSINNYTFTSNSKEKIKLISKIIDYYDKKDVLTIKLIDDFLELHKIFDTFYNVDIFKKKIFGEKNSYDKNETLEIEDQILKYESVFLSMLENKYNRLVNFMIMNFQSDINLLNTIKNIILNDIEIEDDDVQNLSVDNKYCAVNFSDEENEEITNILNSDASKNEAIQKLIQWKQKINFFKALSDDEIALILRDVAFVSVKTDEIIIKENDDTKDIYFLLNGECKVMIGRQPVGIITEKSIFGEFSFITNQPRAATIIANKNSILIKFRIDIDDFHNKSYAYARLFKNIMHELVKKLETTNQKIVNRYKN
jgi:hypothetical protein